MYFFNSHIITYPIEDCPYYSVLQCFLKGDNNKNTPVKIGDIYDVQGFADPVLICGIFGYYDAGEAKRYIVKLL